MRSGQLRATDAGGLHYAFTSVPPREQPVVAGRHIRTHIGVMDSKHDTPLPEATAASEPLVTITDSDGRIVHFNAACERMTGYRQADVLGRSLHEALPAGDVPPQLSPTPAPAIGGALRYVGRLRTRSGESRCIAWTRSSMRTPAGEALTVWSGFDVTGSGPYDGNVVEGEVRLMAVLEAAVDGIITIDDAAVIESVNPAVEKLFGWNAAELVGQPVTKLMPEPYRSEHDGYMHHYLRTGERRIIGIGREVEGLRKDGTVFPLDLAVSEVRLPGRRLFTGILRDISSRRTAENEARQRLEELARASRLADLGELTSSIAHEVNQPLAAIVTFAEACLRMLKAGTGSNDVLCNALEQISAQGERAGNIVHNLRQFVRKGSSSRAPLDVNAVVRDVTELVAYDIRQRGVSLRMELDETLPFVPADHVQIGQVALNLVRNAMDALSSERDTRREVLVTSARSGEHVIEVSVTDSGHGPARRAAAEGVRDLLHDQIERHGHRPVHLPFAGRGARRASDGGVEPRRRRHFPLHTAAGEQQG